MKTWERGVGWAGFVLFAASVGLLLIEPNPNSITLSLMLAIFMLVAAPIGAFLLALRFRRGLGTRRGLAGLAAVLVVSQIGPALWIPTTWLSRSTLDALAALGLIAGFSAWSVGWFGFMRRVDAGPALVGWTSLLVVWVGAVATVSLRGPAPLILWILDPSHQWISNLVCGSTYCLIPVGVLGSAFHLIRLFGRELNQEW